MSAIKQQWYEMLECGIMPLFEYQTSEDDYLIVNIEYREKDTANDEDEECLLFSFDKDRLNDVAFSDEIIEIRSGLYQLNVDEYTDNLDLYLQMIDQEITEGYLLLNNLYYCEG